MSLYDEVISTAEEVGGRWGERPVAVVTGRGWAGLAACAGVEAREWRGESEMVLFRVAGVPVAAVGSEGDSAFGLRVAAALGARFLINAPVAWTLSSNVRPGGVMLFTDHINATGENPLIGIDDPRFGTCFLDMSRPYDGVLQQRAEVAARARGIPLSRGVYLAAPGSDDDLRFVRRLGADAVGVGGAAETILGLQAGLRVLGLAVVAGEGCSFVGKMELARVANAHTATLLDIVEDCIDEIAS